MIMEEILDRLINGLNDAAMSLRKTIEVLDLKNPKHICALCFQLDSNQKLIETIFELSSNELFNHATFLHQEEQFEKQETKCQTSSS